MKIIDKYIAKTVLSGILIVLLVLVGLFTFFSFIDQVDDIGKQRYGLWQAIQYVILEIPRHIYDVFPSAALLGSLLGLGLLANNNELTVMRAAGLSIVRIATSVLKIGIVLIIIVMFIGETLAPMSGQYADSMRSVAKSTAENQQVGFSRYGFWARDGNNFINIYTVFPDGRFGWITLYEFDDNQNLQAVTYAKTAQYQNGQWHLQKVEKNIIGATQVTRQYLESTIWDAVLNPELIKIVRVRPYKLSIVGLAKYIQYLQENGQRSKQYELAFWTRLSYPIVGITMIFLAVPFVFGSLRSVAVGQRILVGAFIGIGFHMINQASGNIGLVYGFPPMLSALFPSVLFLIMAIVLMRRVI
ncbi:MAG: LPS export ABC transporter permease LptG [Thiomargarita sp.]|nr:LPS export ABC transporter permease LptG [Thiomargarita sp.]